MTFDNLSSLVRAFFALWGLLLCLTNVGNTLWALSKKKYLFAALAFLLLLPAYFLWQVVFDRILSEKTGEATAVTQTACAQSWVWWLFAFLLLSVAAIFVLGYNIRYNKNFITPGSIKVFLDEIPCGVCCWRDNGRVLFSNICMNRLCVSLTGGPLLNGNQFCAAVADGIPEVEGKRWRFVCRDIFLNGERLHEMIASDVTTEYAKTQALERDKQELSRLNRELKEYNRSIDDTVRRQEILQAKVNIHDEMNRLMLSTVVAEREDAETLDKIFALWEQNALLLCMEGEVADQKAVGRIEQLADALKIRLFRQNLPAALTEEQRSLLFFAAQEAIANAAKHARATEMTISFDEKEGNLTCFFVNDGAMPKEAVVFSGGLANLARLAEKQDATVSVDVGEKFSLRLRFSKK